MYMKKIKTKNINRALIFIFCILMCITNFAAVVSDNDGSAFITKAEFDSLKNEFQSQLNQYNSNIDGKIEGAIAGYLSGAKEDKEETMLSPKSLLTYPLKFQMKNKLFDWGQWTVNGATPYWAPNYSVYLWGRRSSCTMLIDKTFTSNVINKTFYNGSWQATASGNKYKISGMMKNVVGTLNVNCCFYQLIWQYGNEAQITFGFTLDQSAAAVREEGGAITITRTLVRPSGNTNINFYSGSSTYPLIVDSVWDWGGTSALTVQSETTANEKYMNQIKTHGWGTYEGYTPDGTVFFDSSLKYDSCNYIDFIMNQYDPNRTDSAGKRILLPVAYNEHIYMTNKNNFKKDLQNATRINAQYWDGSFTPSYTWDRRGETYSTVWKFSNIITPGWTLEPQFSGYTSSGINKRSLMEPQNMVYDVTLPYSKGKKEQTMTDGVVLTETIKNYSLMKIDLNIASETPSVKKYLVMSLSPISQSDHTKIATEAAANPNKYLKISNNKNMTGSVYSYELSEGNNTIYISNIKKNNVITYKILWDKNNTSYMNLKEEPKIRGTIE